MQLGPPGFLSITGLLSLYSLVQAASLPACDSANNCSKPLEDITIITPGEFIVAKVQCYGCPTVEWVGSRSSRHHSVTHEENSLFYNISISTSKTELLLNDVIIFPLSKSIGNTEQPPQIYVPQVPCNFSLSSLISTIECTHAPCRNFDGKCFCIPYSASLGSMGVDYEYTFTLEGSGNDSATASGGRGKWTLSFDALGGNNGFMDPFAVFESAEQKMLVMEVQQDEQGALSILGANLTAREHVPKPPTSISFWENVRHFFGAREELEEGYIVYRQDEWDMYGRTGTLQNLLREIWYGLRWILILPIVGGVIGGLIVLYAIYRFVIFIMNEEVGNGNSKWVGKVRNDTWSRERGYYQEELGDEAENDGLLAGDEDIDDKSDTEALPSGMQVGS